MSVYFLFVRWFLGNFQHTYLLWSKPSPRTWIRFLHQTSELTRIVPGLVDHTELSKLVPGPQSSRGRDTWDSVSCLCWRQLWHQSSSVVRSSYDDSLSWRLMGKQIDQASRTQHMFFGRLDETKNQWEEIKNLNFIQSLNNMLVLKRHFWATALMQQEFHV